MQILSHPLRITGNQQNYIGDSGSGWTTSTAISLLPHNFKVLQLVQDMESDGGGIMESLEFDEHGIPTVFYLNVDNLESQEDGGLPNGEGEQIMGLSDGSGGGGHDDHMDVRLVSSEEEPFTHHYSLQEDGTIHYHQGRSSNSSSSSSSNNRGRSSSSNGITTHYETNTVHLGDGSEQEHNFEFEEITTMPLTSSSTSGGSSELNHFQLRLQPSNFSSTSTSSSSLTFPFTVTTTNNIITATATAAASPVTTNGGFLLRPQQTQPLQLQFHAQTPTSGLNSGQKRKLSTSTSTSSTTLSRSSSTSLETNNSAAASIPPHPSPPERILKRPKLLVNLYEAEVGYEFGALLRDQASPTQLSNLIPYSEDYLLRALDREEIPTKVLAHLSPTLRWRRGHLLAQIRDYRRFSSATQVVPGKASVGKGRGGGSGVVIPQYRVLKRSNPVVTELLLRPTTASKLADFEALLTKCSKPGRSHWKRAKIAASSSSTINLNTNAPPAIKTGKVPPRSRPLSSEDEEDDEILEDSDYELELEEGRSKDCGRLSYEQRLELEKEFINKTAGPLCLDPSPRVAIIQNRIQFERLKWRCPTLTRKRPGSPPPPPLRGEEPLFGSSITSAPARAASFSAFITRLKERTKDKDRISGIGLAKEDPLKLLSPFLEYPILDPPTSMEEILRLGPTPEPTTLRPLPIDNFIKKIEEYTLETERRKRPHTTKLSIFQRNGMDAYFGELEMESITEGGGASATAPKPGGGGVLAQSIPNSTSTKCQFELGSSQSVALYVKQFSDIFTEDGRRPCKITYQKVGQPAPQVLYTNSYKTAAAAAAATATGTSVQTTPTTPTASTSVVTTPTPINPSSQQQQQPQPQSQPPVQIVHPQPRSAQPQPSSDPLGSSPLSGQSPQILTRPQQQQQQQQIQAVTASQLVQAQKPQGQMQMQMQGGVGLGPTNVPTASASHQQLLQQRLLRLKQVQAQQQQQQAAAAAAQPQPPHQTALAKLLLTNMNSSTSASTPTTPTSRPITVAVQPQPQKAASSDGSSQNVNLSLSTGTGGVGGVGGSHLSLNLNSMVLDGLLSQNQAAQLRAHGQIQLQQGIQGQQGQGHSAVNILRGNVNQVVVSSGGTLLGSNRYTTAASSSNFNSLLQGQGQLQGHQILHSGGGGGGGGQRILINANNGQQLTLSSSQSNTLTSGGGSNEILEELSVPDLNSLLANVASSSSNQQQQQQLQLLNSQRPLLHLDSSPSTQQHNLNLNLNLNLNSGGGSCGLGLDSVNLNNHHHHHHNNTGTPPPFLVFISPLRSVPVSINANNNPNGRGVVGATSTSLLQQQLNAGPQQLAQGQQLGPQLSLSLDGNVVTSSDGGGGGSGLEPGEYYTMSNGGGGGGGSGVGMGGGTTEIKLEPVDHPSSSTSTSTSTVMIGNTAYSLNVSSSSGSYSSGGGSGSGGGSDSKKDVITLSSLLGSSNKPSGNLAPLILQNPMSQSQVGGGGGGGIVVSSPISSTPRLSALLAGTPSADSGGGGNLLSPGARGGGGISLGGPGGSEASSRTLLDRLAASLSTNQNQGTGSCSSSSGVSSTGGGGSGAGGTSPPVMIRSGLNPIASATPNVVLDHPVLAATLTGQTTPQTPGGQGQSPKLVSAYRQIAPAPMTSTQPPNSSRGKQP